MTFLLFEQSADFAAPDALAKVKEGGMAVKNVFADRPALPASRGAPCDTYAQKTPSSAYQVLKRIGIVSWLREKAQRTRA
jgi:hypothetical protein